MYNEFEVYKDSLLNFHVLSLDSLKSNYKIKKIKCCVWNPRYEHDYLPQLFVKSKNISTSRLRNDFLTCFYLDGDSSKIFEIINYTILNRKDKNDFVVIGENIPTDIILKFSQQEKDFKNYYISNICFLDKEGRVFKLMKRFNLYQKY